MPAPTSIWKGPTNALVMQPNSPTLEYGDRVKVTDIYKGVQSLCAANMLARGTFGTGFRAGWVVNQCTVTTERGNVGTLTIQWEAGGSGAIQPLPIGDFSLKPQELYPKIERAGFFEGILPETVNIVYNALYAGPNSVGAPAGGTKMLTTYIAPSTGVFDEITSPVQLALAKKLLEKLSRGEESFYMVGWRYTYEVYSYTAPELSKGGFPPTPLPPLFVGDHERPGKPGGPLSDALPDNVQWLRLADELDHAGVAGSMYKKIVTWLGGPALNGVGYWDPDIYQAPS